MSMSVFADAITQSMVASMDPMNVVVRRMFEGQATKAELDLDEQREAFIDKLNAKLQSKIDAGVDVNNDVVCQAWSRLIEKHSNKR